jgi:L-iditol 2-dehydrogenase
VEQLEKRLKKSTWRKNNGMRSAFLSGLQQFTLRTIPDPTPPDGGLLLRVEACGVCGSDLRRWKEGPTPGAGAGVPGHEIAGVVVATGSNVDDYAPGDRLAVAPDVHCGTCWYCQRGQYNLCDNLRFLGITPGLPGGFADRLVLTREVLTDGIVHRIPDGLSYPLAALAEPFSSVLAAHIKAGTGLRDTVLVMGGGPIGCMHIAVAHASGARVILSEPAAIRRKLAEPFQPDLVIDPHQEDLASKISAFTGGLGVDTAICANPVATTQTQAVELVRKGGRVILFGGLPKANPVTCLDGNRIHYGEIQVVGAFSYHPTMHAMALEFIQRNSDLAAKFITHSFTLEQINEAFQMAASGEALKVLVRS